MKQTFAKPPISSGSRTAVLEAGSRILVPGLGPAPADAGYDGELESGLHENGQQQASGAPADDKQNGGVRADRRKSSQLGRTPVAKGAESGHGRASGGNGWSNWRERGWRRQTS